MATILEWRGQLQKVYAKYSVYIMKGLQLILGLLVFGAINSGIGFMERASSIVCTVGLAVICTFLPLSVMAFAATTLVLLHLYTLSAGVAIVAAMLFLLMYIFYFRFCSKNSWLVLLTAVSFTIKIPLVIPVAAGLLGGPAGLIPVALGTFSYYMLHIAKMSSNTYKAGELIEVITTFTKQTLTNKEMLVMLAAVVICGILVYGIRISSLDHSWKIASVAGAVAEAALCTVGNVALEVHISYGLLAADVLLAILTGLFLEVMFLSVDYSRTEHLEFEDDEYHYYVKAVPKLIATEPEKNVKQIAGHQDEILPEKKNTQNIKKEPAERKNKEHLAEGQTPDDILLTRSLNKELGLGNPDQKK